MRYRVDGREVRSENAALSVERASAHLVDWLADNVRVTRVLDYGCGKLRYAGHLARHARSLTLVDSREQLERVQKLGARRLTVRSYARRWPNARALTVDEFLRDHREYDFALCANVLSAIPSAPERTTVVRRIRKRLRRGGRALFVTQFRNSYFTEMADSDRAVPCGDGWLLDSRRGSFYYGRIPPDLLSRRVTAAGLRILEAWTNDGSAYVLAGRRG